jgi:hypothetical protein
MSSKPHVLIVGAGMTGLLLAQNLKSHNISFSIYERDPNAQFRGAGWGLAIHWAVDTFLSLLPQHLRDQIPEATVDPEALARGERGKFPFFDLVTGERRFENVSEKRIRVSRMRVRRLMLEGLDVQVRVAHSTVIRYCLLRSYCSEVEQNRPRNQSRPRHQNHHHPLRRRLASARHPSRRLRRVSLASPKTTL